MSAAELIALAHSNSRCSTCDATHDRHAWDEIDSAAGIQDLIDDLYREGDPLQGPVWVDVSTCWATVKSEIDGGDDEVLGIPTWTRSQRSRLYSDVPIWTAKLAVGTIHVHRSYCGPRLIAGYLVTVHAGFRDEVEE